MSDATFTDQGPRAGLCVAAGGWREQLQRRLHTVDDLARLGVVDAGRRDDYGALLRTFPFAVTPYYAALMDAADPEDAIRRQCIPSLDELSLDGEEDPFDEEQNSPVPGLVRRFRDRVLVVLTNRCAVYCRHCTRKRIWRAPGGECSEASMERIARAVEGTPEVREVLLSGGDPLLLSDDKLDRLLSRLRRIRHIEVMRIGTRAPVVLPMRITEDLCGIFKKHRPLFVNTQFNHRREVTDQAAEACERLLLHGIPVANQAVLLRGVNDSADTLLALFHALQKVAVRPYCLYQCDPVRGAAHFGVNVDRGIALMGDLFSRTSRFCLPEYVMDTREHGKIPLHPRHARPAPNG